MKTLAELNALKRQITERSQLTAVPALSHKDALELVEQAIADRATLNRWFGFLRFMAGRSSWASQINDMLDEYLYGTSNKDVQAAAQHYAELTRLHPNNTQ